MIAEASYLTANAFYNSTNGSTLTTSANSTSSNLKKFNATRIFQKYETPVGAIIAIDSGFQYRPEGWTALDATNATRLGNVTDSIVVIDEAWWGDYQYRAFNVGYISGAEISAEQFGSLRIYIPKS